MSEKANEITRRFPQCHISCCAMVKVAAFNLQDAYTSVPMDYGHRMILRFGIDDQYFNWFQRLTLKDP